MFSKLITVKFAICIKIYFTLIQIHHMLVDIMQCMERKYLVPLEFEGKQIQTELNQPNPI